MIEKRHSQYVFPIAVVASGDSGRFTLRLPRGVAGVANPLPLSVPYGVALSVADDLLGEFSLRGLRGVVNLLRELCR